MSAESAPRVPVFTLPKLIVWVVALVLFAYVLWLAISNVVSVVDSVTQFNEFVKKNGASTLQTSIPWVALVLDLLIAPAGFVVAWFASRRMDLTRTIVVHVAALCAVSALWFDIAQYVSSTVHLGS
jgi:ABC-type spermidine/putrescine transport system permease subunit I